MNAIGCKYCDGFPAGRCKACGMNACKDHLVHDDPFHASGLMRRPADFCKDCYVKKQGKVTAACILAITLGLGTFITFMIVWW